MPPSANVDVKVLSTFVDDCELVEESVDVVGDDVEVVKVVSWVVVEPMSFELVAVSIQFAAYHCPGCVRLYLATPHCWDHPQTKH